MQYIERREVGAPNSKHLFNARQTGRTIAKYSCVWLSIVCYIWQTHGLAEPAREANPATEDRGELSQ